MGRHKYIESPEILRPDVFFELPFKKNKDGNYKVLPNTNHLGGKNELRKLNAKKTKIAYLYLIRLQDTNKYKIGVTTNPKRRLADISSILPFQINVLAINQINNPYDFEQEIINKYKPYLIKNEWFEFNIEQAKEIMITLHNQQVKESIYG